MDMRARLGTLLLAMVLLSCTQGAAPTGQPRGESRPAGEPARQRTVTFALRLEPKGVALRPPSEETANVDHRRLFNADIANIDDQTVPRPYLVEALPDLNTDS